MKTGTLILEIYGELLEKQSIDILQNIMHKPLLSVSESLDFDYKRFEYFAATMIWVCHLKLFWNNDTIYNTLKLNLNRYFTNWELEITLLLHDKQP